MTYTEYTALYDTILSNENPSAPYDNPDYINYTKLNESRQRRWTKRGELNQETKEVFKKIDKPQHWIIISEPWCGDASHAVPFLAKLADLNPLVTYDIQLRDTEPFLIDNYLTDGNKSIPKLIVRNENGEDIFTWGPRPKRAQAFFLELKAKGITIEEQKIGLQEWYNENKGIDIQTEIISLLKENGLTN